MNKYIEIRNKHEKRVNAFPISFAFSDKQFDEGMKKLGLTPDDTDKVISIGGGGFIRKTDVEAFGQMWDDLRKEHNDLIEQDKTGDGYIKDMFVFELENYEFGYTHELNATLTALEFTYEDVMNTPNLKHGLELACKEVVNKSYGDDYEV